MQPSGGQPAAGAHLDQVLRRLDVGLLRHLAGPDPAQVTVAGIGIVDPTGDLGPSEHLLLVPGVTLEGPDAGDWLGRLLTAPVPAVVVRGDRIPAGSATDGPDQACLLGIDPAMGWDRAFLLLSAALDAAAGASVAADGTATRMGDLFALADAVAGSVHGNVLVLDAQNRVIAFSGKDEPTDEWRRDTILGRQVPEDWQERFRREGVYDRMAEPGQVVAFELPDTPGFRPRRAIGVHAGGRRIGLLAAAQGESPFDEQTDAALREAARMAALPLLRHANRHAEGAHRQDERLRELLAGSAPPASAVARLGMDLQERFTVMALGIPGSGETERLERWTSRLRMLLPAGVEGLTVVDGSRLYALCTGSEQALGDLTARPEWLERGLAGEALRAGVARSVRGSQGIGEAREEADRVLDAMLAGVVDRAAASPETAWPHVVLHDLHRQLRSEDAMRYGRAAALAAHDRAHDTDYVRTLCAYLAHRGDSAACAETMHIHPNTLRYRVRRACEIAQLDLDDSVERLICELQLSALVNGR